MEKNIKRHTKRHPGDTQVTPRWPRSNPGYTKLTLMLHQSYAKFLPGNSWKRPGNTRVTPRLHAGRTQVTPGHVHFTPASGPSYTQVTPWLHLGCTRPHRQCAKGTPRLRQGYTKVALKSHPRHVRATPGSSPGTLGSLGAEVSRGPFEATPRALRRDKTRRTPGHSQGTPRPRRHHPG